MIVFTSLNFMFRFLVIFLAVYYVVPKRLQNAVLFLGSLVFYGFGQWQFLPVLFGLTVINFGFGRWLSSGKKRGYQRSYLLPRFVIVFAFDAVVLLLFKYLALALDPSWLPLGISFYIFKMISFQSDAYNGKIPPNVRFFEAAAYFTMFPQVTQGPIMRFHVEDFRKPHRLSLLHLEQGLEYFVVGMGMKILLADRLAILWNEIQKIGFESISTPLAWLGIYGYSLELYFDFWGYSLMAAGLGVMLGFPFVENFDHPYASKSISEYYRRWHVTLGSWFKDYIYIPLGGSRKGAAKTVRNLLIVWLITGLWHGGTLNFIIWGMVIGIIIVLEKYPLKKLMEKTRIPGWILVFVVIPLTWGIFAITDLSDLEIYFSRLFPFVSGELGAGADFIKYAQRYWLLFAAGILLLLPPVSRFLVRERKGFLQFIRILLLLAVFLGSLYLIGTTSSNPFLYYSF